MAKKDGTRTLEEVLAELSQFDALKAEAKSAIEAELAELDAKKAKLHRKLAELGFGSVITRTRKTKADDGERKQRQCRKCGGFGHRATTCKNEPTAEWLASQAAEASSR